MADRNFPITSNPIGERTAPGGLLASPSSEHTALIRDTVKPLESSL